MTAPDLDALEKLADRCSFGDPWYTEENLLGRQNFGQFLPQDRAFIAAANPATIKALIADLAEAKRLLAESVDLTGLCTTPERFSECGSGEVFLRMTAHNAQARAFLARNGKGEG